MILHASTGAWRRRLRRPNLGRTLCGRWVDVIRIANDTERVTCEVCARRYEVTR